MFKFDFGKSDFSKDKNDDNLNNKDKLNWLSSYEILEEKLEDDKYDDDDFTEKEIFPSVRMNLIKVEVAIEKLKLKDCDYVVEAEAVHSDLLPAKYEGGLKIWECTYDLGNYILERKYDLSNKLVVDLGCGAGIIGLLALQNGASVHFQDYNSEIIKYVTIPNVKINNESRIKSCKFFAGDWQSFTANLNEKYKDEEKYDFIFTSETIYNADNHEKLFDVFRCRLKKGGIGLIAGKTHYFGVGGGMRQFEQMIRSDARFRPEVVWKSEIGLQREILQITH